MVSWHCNHLKSSSLPAPTQATHDCSTHDRSKANPGEKREDVYRNRQAPLLGTSPDVRDDAIHDILQDSSTTTSDEATHDQGHKIWCDGLRYHEHSEKAVTNEIAGPHSMLLHNGEHEHWGESSTGIPCHHRPERVWESQVADPEFFIDGRCGSCDWSWIESYNQCPACCISLRAGSKTGGLLRPTRNMLSKWHSILLKLAN